jgi:hypothetical protein
MRRLMYLFLALLLIAVGFVSGYFWPHNASNAVSSAQGCFEVSSAKLQPPQHSGFTPCDAFSCIVGSVRNICAQRFNTIWLTYNLYDSSGVQIGSTDGMVENLEPHSMAHFWAEVDDTRRVSKFKIIKVAVAPNQ